MYSKFATWHRAAFISLNPVAISHVNICDAMLSCRRQRFTLDQAFFLSSADAASLLLFAFVYGLAPKEGSEECKKWTGRGRHALLQFRTIWHYETPTFYPRLINRNIKSEEHIFFLSIQKQKLQKIEFFTGDAFLPISAIFLPNKT